MGFAELTTFLGWVSVINIVILLAITIIIISCRGCMNKLLIKFFAANEDDLNRLYLGYLAKYEIIILAFNIAPYLALRFFV